MIRVMICDDHPVLCDGLASVLSQDPDITVLPPVSTEAQALETSGCERPDILPLDVTLPDGSGIDLIPRIRRASPHTRVIMVTARLSRGLIESALSAGALGYLSKKSPGLHVIGCRAYRRARRTVPRATSR